MTTIEHASDNNQLRKQFHGSFQGSGNSGAARRDVSLVKTQVKGLI